MKVNKKVVVRVMAVFLAVSLLGSVVVGMVAALVSGSI